MEKSAQRSFTQEELISLDVQSCSVSQLKGTISSLGGDYSDCIEKKDLQTRAKKVIDEAIIKLKLESNPVEDLNFTFASPEVSNRTITKKLLFDHFKSLSGGLDFFTHIPKQKNKVCGKVFVDGDLVYNCQTCEFDPTCCVCKECFDGANHEGKN